MADRQLVLAVFPDEVAADSAAVALKDSGIADGDAIGILALDSDGKLKQDKVGARSTGKGAAIGGVIAVFSTALLGPAVLTRRGGGRASPQEPGAQRCRQGASHSGSAVGQGGSRCDVPYDTVPAISDRLTQLGGTTQSLELTDDAVEAASTATAAV